METLRDVSEQHREAVHDHGFQWLDGPRRLSGAYTGGARERPAGFSMLDEDKRARITCVALGRGRADGVARVRACVRAPLNP